jgi:hypothetical protein
MREKVNIRGYWLLQELTTDEAVIAWNDGTIKTFIPNMDFFGPFVTAFLHVTLSSCKL